MGIKEKIILDLGLEEISEIDIMNVPSEIEGDYAIPCFKLAKLHKKSPAVIAQEISNSVKCKGIVEKIVAVGPYVNIILNKSEVAKLVYNNILNNDNYGKNQSGNNKTICIDFSSITLSKHVHIGHLCTTVIGACLARLYEYSGYKVVRINYLGDMGTPFGKILSMYKLHGNEDEVNTRGVDEIQRLYSLFATEAEKDPSLIEDARAWGLKIEKNDPEAKKLCDWFKEIALEEVKKTYKLLGIDFDDWRGELFYNDKTQEVIDMLENKNLLVESEGAKVVDLNDYGMGMCLIQRSDGGTLYTTRDIAAAIDRFNLYNFDKSLYVTGIEQNLHFAAFFKVLEIAGYEWAKNLVHVNYGRLSTKLGKISGREGNTPIMKDIFKASIEKAKDALVGRDVAEETAVDIGVSAVVFSVLKTERIKDSVFDLEQAISFEGNSSVYLQYSHVRLQSILSKEQVLQNSGEYIDLLHEKDEMELLLHLDLFPKVVQDAMQDHEPYYVSRYALETATLVNKFYNNIKVISDDKKLTQARLALCNMSALVLGKSMEILGVKTVDKM